MDEQLVGHFREWEIQRVRRYVTEFHALLCDAEEWRDQYGPADQGGGLPVTSPDSSRRATAIIS